VKLNYTYTNQFFERSFAKNWDRVALTDYNQPDLYYRDVATSVAKLHLLFEEYGIKRGDKIAICGRNQANWGIIFLAAMTYGAVAVPILHEFKPDNIHFIVTHSDSRLLFVSNSIWENLTETSMPTLEVALSIKDLSILYSNGDKMGKIFSKLDNLFAKKYKNGYKPSDISYYKDKREELCLISYTSGTTGMSKGVMVPYRAIWSNIFFANERLPQFDCDGRLVSMLPMAHMYGLMFEFLFEMSVGAHVWFLTRVPSPKIIMEAFAKVRPTLIISVPLIIEKIYKRQILPLLEKGSMKALLKAPLLNKLLLRKIGKKLDDTFGGKFIYVIVGGAAFSREAEQFFKSVGFRYTVGYGMTETAPIITYCFWSEAKLYGVGTIVPRMEMKIDSPEPDKISGEILVKGDNVFLGYYKNKEATKEAFTKDGWMKTGDMGIIDSDGYLFINGRCKNMILGASGQNIYPEEIEDILNNKPYVAESLVVEQGGKLVALVYPDYDAARADNVKDKDIPKLLDDAIKALNAELPNYAQIASMQIRQEEFEKTPKRSIKRFLYQV
jgi:long-chain acyl-CoA synthetase